MKKIFYKIIICLFFWSVAFPVFGLTVSPAKIEITGDPGQTITGEIELFNEESTEKTFFISFENFEPRGDSGAPYFIGAKDGLATWISVQDKITVSPGERIPVSYSVDIPKDTKPGGYFSAVFFGTQPVKNEDGGKVSIGGKIGVLILLRVSGDIEESGGLLGFTTSNNKKFFTGLPISFEYRFNNTGGDRVVPKGEIKIKNTFRITSKTFLANENEGSVLPNSTRKFEVLWPSSKNEKQSGFFGTAWKQLKDFHFGWYTANLYISWGESNQTAKTSYNFFIFPWQIMTLLLFLFIIIFFGGKFFLKKYNRFIISKAMRQ